MQLHENEEIRPIIGYERRYSITSFGRVYSHMRNIFLCPQLNFEYLKVGLYKNGKKRHMLIHRLVAIGFIPNPNNLPEVNHIDTNKSNNYKNNLEWCTHLENSKHASINGLYGQKRVSRYFGVTSENSKYKKWRAQITINGKSKYLGACFTELEAARKYNDFIIDNNMVQPLNNI